MNRNLDPLTIGPNAGISIARGEMAHVMIDVAYRGNVLAVQEKLNEPACLWCFYLMLKGNLIATHGFTKAFWHVGCLIKLKLNCVCGFE